MEVSSLSHSQSNSQVLGNSIGAGEAVDDDNNLNRASFSKIIQDLHQG